MDECMMGSVVMYSKLWVDYRIKLDWRLVSGLARNKGGKPELPGRSWELDEKAQTELLRKR